MARYLGWVYLLLFIAVSNVTAKRIKDMIYMPLDGVAACFRRHNGTHQFGCSSSRSGSVGVIHIVEVEGDVQWLERNATAGPYTVVMPFSMFTKDILMRLKDTKNINGVLLARNVSHDRPVEYSPEDTCPNRYSGYQRCNEAEPWNPFGSALLLEDWPFPMFYMENQTQLEAIKECFWKHNAHDLETQGERSLCALEMKSFMYSALNSESCMRRSTFILNFDPTPFCDPLGDNNIHWSLAPLNEGNNSVIMVTARLDTFSLFDGISPGAGSAVTGLVTLLATAYYLNLLNATVEDTNIVFSLLNGEAFDYIGSSRMVHDLKEGHFNALGGVNLKLNDIKYIVEFGQVGEGDLYLHTHNKSGNDLLNELHQALPTKIVDNSVPPASVQSFLQANANLSTIVVANHEKQFINRYYNGILDDAENLHFNRNSTENLASSLTKIAVKVAGTLYRKVTGTEPPVEDEASVKDMVTEMLLCYLERANCDLFRVVSPPGTKLSNQVLSLYVGVYKSPNLATVLTGQLFAFLTGEKLPELNETMCYEKHLMWMGGNNYTGLCINSTINYSVASSPAFIIDDYDMKSGVYSTWTESIWQSLSVRMFLKPSAATERLSMILGSSVAGASFLLVWFINSRADILFNSRRTVNY